MDIAFVSMLLAAYASSPAAPQPHGATFHTKKSVSAVQKCLTDKLSEIGEVVAMNAEENATTLVLRESPDDPMIIEITPQSVTVTTRFIHGTRKLVQACV